MITGFFILLITALANAIVGLLPTYGLPTEWVTGVNMIWGYMNALSFLLPVGTLLTVLGIALFFHVSIFVWHLSLKLYHMLRGM